MQSFLPISSTRSVDKSDRSEKGDTKSKSLYTRHLIHILRIMNKVEMINHFDLINTCLEIDCFWGKVIYVKLLIAKIMRSVDGVFPFYRTSLDIHGIFQLYN